jgi:hypothetical protein
MLSLLAGAAFATVADRVIWAKQIVGEINLANVKVSDVNCSANDWLELAPGKESGQPMRYRCGMLFWPLYNSGESIIAGEMMKNAVSQRVERDEKVPWEELSSQDPRFCEFRVEEQKGELVPFESFNRERIGYFERFEDGSVGLTNGTGLVRDVTTCLTEKGYGSRLADIRPYK